MLSLVLIPFWYASNGWCQTDVPFTQIMIQTGFETLLRPNAAFMAEGGARLLESDNGCAAIVGISRDHHSEADKQNPQKLVRMGATKARAAIVEFIFGVEVEAKKSTASRHHEGKVAKRPSSTIQTLQEIKAISKAEIDQLPVIGTWLSKDGNIFYTAVGKRIKPCEEIIAAKGEKAEDELKDAVILDAKEPFLSLLKASPLLCRHGGVKGYEIDKQKKVVMAVGYAPIKDSIVKARKIARLKAVRCLLAENEEVQIIQVQWMQDQEKLILVNGRETYIQLSSFWSMQKEHVAGRIKTLPVAVVWHDMNGKYIFVAIGK